MLEMSVLRLAELLSLVRWIAGGWFACGGEHARRIAYVAGLSLDIPPSLLLARRVL